MGEVMRQATYNANPVALPKNLEVAADMVATKEEVMNKPMVAQAFNRWMDDYTKYPASYEDITDAALRHLNEKLDGRDPTYGEVCAEILSSYLAELSKVV